MGETREAFAVVEAKNPSEIADITARTDLKRDGCITIHHTPLNLPDF